MCAWARVRRPMHSPLTSLLQEASARPCPADIFAPADGGRAAAKEAPMTSSTCNEPPALARRLEHNWRANGMRRLLWRARPIADVSCVGCFGATGAG
jgi:hypothetical protein